jgi:hypothetical protein
MIVHADVGFADHAERCNRDSVAVTLSSGIHVALLSTMQEENSYMPCNKIPCMRVCAGDLNHSV